MFSAFSYLLREAKLVAGEAERSLYYNMEAGAARTKRPSGWAAPYLAVTGSCGCIGRLGAALRTPLRRRGSASQTLRTAVALEPGRAQDATHIRRL